MQPDFSHPCLWNALEVALIKHNKPNPPLDYPPFTWETNCLSSYNNLSHAFSDASVCSARPTKKWRPQKSIQFNEITLNVLIHSITIFNKIWQNGFRIMLKNPINFFFRTMCLSNIFFIDEIILLKTFFSVPWLLCKAVQFLAKYQEENISISWQNLSYTSG